MGIVPSTPGCPLSETSPEDLITVVLDAEHRSLGGRMVPFSGYSLPVQYPTGIIAEHKWTREHAGLFDVSHMGPSFLTLVQKSGDAARDHAAIAAIIEPLVCGDIAGLKPGQLRYTLLLNDEGGIRDDLMIGRPVDPAWAGTLYVIVNAATKHADWQHISGAAGESATLTRADNCGLLALQGPEAVAVLETLVPGVTDMAFMTYASFDWSGTRLRPYAQLTYDYEHDDHQHSYRAGFVGGPTAMDMPISNQNGGYGTLLAGVNAELGKSLRLGLGASTTIAQPGARSSAINVTLSAPF